MENPNQSQNEYEEIPEEIQNAIRTHYSKLIQDSQKALIVDLEGVKTEKIEELEKTLIPLLKIDFNYVYKSNIEVVDEIIDLYPYKKIFLVTSLDHINKHFLLKLETNFNGRREMLMEYEKDIKYHTIDYRIYTDGDNGDVIGIWFKAHSLEDNKTIKKIMRSMGETFLNSVDDEIVTTVIDKYAGLKKTWFIYQNKPLKKYMLSNISSREERLEGEDLIKDIRWYVILEVESNLINDLRDP